MTWHSPWSFLLLGFLAAVAFYLWWQRRKFTPSLQVSFIGALVKSNQGIKNRIKYLPLALMMSGVALMIVALARPQAADTQVRKNIDGIDIMIAFDISDSMLIEDMRPSNRLEAAKETIKRFIQGRSSDRIGIVVFAGESFTLVPLTLDYQMIVSRVEEITTAQQARIKDGTAIGVGLANAAGRLRDSTAKSRIVIFMTDGENNSGTIDPETGLSIAKGFDVKIYSIGLGKSGPTRIPVYNQDIFGNKVKSYQPYESRVNEELLARFASETGGKYFHAEQETALQNVFNEIDSLEKTKIEINKFTRYTELFENWALAGLFLYLCGWIFSLTIFRRGP